MADFYWPPAACDGDEVRQGRGTAFRCPAQVERVLVFVPVREPADQQELPRVRGARQCPVAVAGAFRPVPARPLLEHRIPDSLVSADDGAGGEGDPVVARDDDDVGQRQRPQRLPELPAPAVHLVSGGPGDPQPGRHQPFHLRDRQVRLRGERQRLRDPGLPPARRIRRPAPGHVHVEVGPGLPERGDQRREHPGHAVLHLPGDPGVLRGHARSRLSFAQVSGLVERQPRADQVIRVVRQHLLGQIRQQAAQFLPGPGAPAEQGLHPVRPLMPGLQRQLPAVRPRVLRQDPDVLQRRRDGAPLPHDPAQQARDQRVRSLAAFRGVFYAGHCGRGHVLFSRKIQERATAASRYARVIPGRGRNLSRDVTPPRCHTAHEQDACVHPT